jgi:peptidoglycan/xylan/chitin deacetylase (PgdA/CDA1 family)
MSPRQIARAVASRAIPRRLLQMSGPASSGSACLTYDDGPHPEHTPRLLDALRDAGAVATFFVIGAKAERHPEIVRRIVAEGHALGNHSYSHPRPEAVDAAGLVAEARAAAGVLAAIVGRPSPMFRPPHGGVTLAKMLGLWRAGHSIVLWSVDPKDFACTTADEVRIGLRRRPLRAGDIVLMHDDTPFAAVVVADVVADALRASLTLATPDAWGRPIS